MKNSNSYKATQSLTWKMFLNLEKGENVKKNYSSPWFDEKLCLPKKETVATFCYEKRFFTETSSSLIP